MRLTAVISLRDNYSNIMRQAARTTTNFRSDVERTRRAMDAAFRREQRIRIDTQRARTDLSRFETAMRSLRDRTVRITARTEQFFDRHRNVAAALNKLTSAPHYITIKARDMTVGAISGAAKAGVGIAATGAATAAGVGIASLVGAAGLERQQISMEHFIGINNKKMSQDQVKAQSDKYIQDLRKNADVTPFETGEVISAGTRAIGIASGDTKQAMNMLKLSEDMAALTPGKTISDAMEAIADLKTGETERMKEFGFKISQAQVLAAGGKMGNIKNDQGIALTDMFQGGSEKLSKSSAGLWSTITGTMKSGVTDMGIKTLETLKPQLQKWADALSGGGANKLFAAGSKLMESLANSMTKGVNKSIDYFDTHFLNNPKFKNLPTTEAKIKFVFDELKSAWDGWYESEGRKKITDIGSTIGKEIGGMIVSGLNEVISTHPLLSGLAVAAATPGPIQVKIGAGAVVTGLGITPKVQEVLETGHDKLQAAGNSIIPKSWRDALQSVQNSDFVKKMRGWQGFSLPGAPSGRNPASIPKKAIGMRSVPYDNYPALLHQGERVLTAQEANQSSGKSSLTFNLHFDKNSSKEASNILSILRSALEPVGYNMAPTEVD